jgi:hypothetical protein
VEDHATQSATNASGKTHLPKENIHGGHSMLLIPARNHFSASICVRRLVLTTTRTPSPARSHVDKPALMPGVNQRVRCLVRRVKSHARGAAHTIPVLYHVALSVRGCPVMYLATKLCVVDTSVLLSAGKIAISKFARSALPTTRNTMSLISSCSAHYLKLCRSWKLWTRC